MTEVYITIFEWLHQRRSNENPPSNTRENSSIGFAEWYTNKLVHSVAEFALELTAANELVYSQDKLKEAVGAARSGAGRASDE